MTDTPDTSPEAVERFAEYVTDAECKHGCGTMTFCICALAADSVDMMRALSRQRDAARAEGFAEAQEAAVGICQGYRGDTRVALYDPRSQACDDLCVTLADAIRALQPKERPHD